MPCEPARGIAFWRGWGLSGCTWGVWGLNDVFGRDSAPVVFFKARALHNKPPLHARTPHPSSEKPDTTRNRGALPPSNHDETRRASTFNGIMPEERNNSILTRCCVHPNPAAAKLPTVDGVPRESGGVAAGGLPAPGATLRGGADGGRVRHFQGKGLPGRHEAVGLQGAGCVPRRVEDSQV